MLIPNCTIQTRRGGTVINPALVARIQAPTDEQIMAAGGLLRYYVKVDSPITNIRTGDLLFVTICQTNPDLVAASASGWAISAPRDRAGLFPRFLFTATRKDQP